MYIIYIPILHEQHVLNMPCKILDYFFIFQNACVSDKQVSFDVGNNEFSPDDRMLFYKPRPFVGMLKLAFCFILYTGSIMLPT